MRDAPPAAQEEAPPADDNRGRDGEPAGEARERGREAGQEAAEEARENRENAGRPDEGAASGRWGPPGSGAPRPARRRVGPTIRGRRRAAHSLSRPVSIAPVVPCTLPGAVLFSWSAMLRALLLASRACCWRSLGGDAPPTRARCLPMASELSLPAITRRPCGYLRRRARPVRRARASTTTSAFASIGLRDYDAAEATFAALAAEFPALRELAEYNRGLALRAHGNAAEARVAFERARASATTR